MTATATGDEAVGGSFKPWQIAHPVAHATSTSLTGHVAIAVADHAHVTAHANVSETLVSEST